MKALFLESKAAEQCLAYAQAHAWDEADTQDLLNRCYANNVTRLAAIGKGPDDFWVNKCLDGDLHKWLSVGALFLWNETPEDHDYWQRIHEWGY